ncbi:hypothetical protein [Aeromicrobium sp. 179-A 4D2 NHS]|uniref:hypothetical protein n=1 Tax=Aeromicrobium sp. 179-A 4D2 NHS TaxID=3142375 RepID=UPI0039A30FE4
MPQTLPETTEPFDALPDAGHPIDLHDRDGWEEYLSTHLTQAAMRNFKQVAASRISVKVATDATSTAVEDLCTDVALLACEHASYTRIYGDRGNDDIGTSLRDELDSKWDALEHAVEHGA